MPNINGEVSIKKWIVIGVPLIAFLGGTLAVGAWKGEITNRLEVVEGIAKNNTEDAKRNEEIHRDEMWAIRRYLHSLDKNNLVVATKMGIPKSELSDLKLEMPKRN